jgi:hypothetical protein
MTTSAAEDGRHDLIRLLDYARNLRVSQPVYEPAYQHLVHLFVLRGSRAELLAALDRRLRAVVAGQSALVLIEGVSGIGKTTFTMAHQARAQELGAAFIVMRCYEQSSTPFWLWQDVVRSIERATGASSAALPAPFGKGQSARRWVDCS